MKKKIYLATPIRGSAGSDASEEMMALNCRRAKKNVEVLGLIYPYIEWVCVAPYDKIVQKLLAKGKVSIGDVLEADFELGDMCDGLLAHFWDVSEGAQAELLRQKERGKPVLSLSTDFWEIWKTDWDYIDSFVDTVVTWWPTYNGR